MSAERLPVDDPTTALFDLADRMAENYKKIGYLKYYAYFFMGITIVLLVAIFLSLLTSGQVALAFIILAVIICGIILLRLVLFTKNFLDDFNTNFCAIRMVREIDPMPRVPKGNTPIERLALYLQNQDPAAMQELNAGARAHFNHELAGQRWPIVILRKSRFLGPGDYLCVASEGNGQPKVGDFIHFEKDLEHVTKSTTGPNRAILLYKVQGAYDGITDDLYSYLTEKEHFVLKGGKKHRVKLQVFVEHSGRYEIIPLLP